MAFASPRLGSRRFPSLLFLLVALVLSVLPAAAASKKAWGNARDTLHVSHESTHAISIGAGYGFGTGGVANLTLSNLYIAGLKDSGGDKDKDKDDGDKGSKGDSEYKVYFVLRKYESESAYAADLELALAANTCLIGEEARTSPSDVILDASDDTKWNTEVTVSHKFTAEEKGLWFLTYQRCSPIGADADYKTTFTFEHHFYNVDADGTMDYLSVGMQPLPTLFLVFGLLYLACFLLWTYKINKSKLEELGEAAGVGSGIAMFAARGVNGDPRKEIKVHHIHHIMTALLLLKVITVFAESARYHYIRVTGTGEAWSVVYYFFGFIKSMMLFVVILLIGSGWSFVKPFLNGNEKKLIFGVLILQVIDNIALLVVASDSPGSTSYSSWENVLHLVDLICCCAILFPIVWQIRSLETAVAANGRAERSIKKLTLFRQFYIMVVCYIYFTRIIVFLVATALTYESTWMQWFFDESATLVFYVVTGWKFRPVTNNPYLALKSDEDDEDGTGLNMEEFGLHDEGPEEPRDGPNAL